MHNSRVNTINQFNEFFEYIGIYDSYIKKVETYNYFKR